MKCLIRLDDISPDMDWNRFNKVRKVLEDAEVLPLIGVVPNCRDELLHKEPAREDFWDTIRTLQQKGWRIAQHGTNHTYVTKDSGILGINPFSEFAGVPYEEQIEKIRTGQSVLEQHGIHTEIFMAPGHTFDANTLKALVECGFSTITDGLTNHCYMKQSLLFVPCKMIGNYRHRGIDTICLHTNLMSNEEIDKLSYFIQNNRSAIIDFDIDVLRKEAKNISILDRAYERVFLFVRKLKDRIAHSTNLSWYMRFTNHEITLIKWLKRIIFLPVLIIRMICVHK